MSADVQDRIAGALWGAIIGETWDSALDVSGQCELGWNAQALLSLLEGLLEARTWHSKAPVAEAMVRQLRLLAEKRVMDGEVPDIADMSDLPLAVALGIWQWRDPPLAQEWAPALSGLLGFDSRRSSAGVYARVLASVISGSSFKAVVKDGWFSVHGPMSVAERTAFMEARKRRSSFMCLLRRMEITLDEDAGFLLGALVGAEVGFLDLPDEYSQQLAEADEVRAILQAIPEDRRKLAPRAADTDLLPGFDRRLLTKG